jgi:outer membrane protein assembly factor BamA
MLPALFWCGISGADEPDPLDPERLEAEEVVIGSIILEKADVFDLSDPKENNALYRLANRLHIITKDSVIEQQLLFASGETFSKRRVEETERILRRNTYFYDASVTPVNRQDGTVDLQVNTRDVWTLKPGFSFSRSGGENRTLIKLEELNLFGWGQQMLVARSWNSLSVIRPFYKLDARWTAGTTGTDFDIERRLYQLGEKAAEFRHEREFYSVFGGWSAGLRNGWVRRYTAGVAYDENLFSVVPDATLPPAIPEDRELVYPYFTFEVVEDRFETARNRNQIKRTEDFLTGKRFSATLGWSDEGLGADRDAALYWLSASRSYGDLAKSAVLLSADASGRIEDGDAMNALLSIDARVFNQQSDQRTFATTLSATYGNNLDLDNPVELGGDTGLRGYPLRYQSGDSKILLTVEQRYFWNWYPFRLFRVGGAIFADVGRTWGDDPLGGESLGWLSDVGFGLRLAPTRTGTRSIIHVDLAFPLNGDDSIDSVQFLIESKKSF